MYWTRSLGEAIADAGMGRACRAMYERVGGMDSRMKRGTRHPIITRGALEKVRAGRFVVLVQKGEGAVAC